MWVVYVNGFHGMWCFTSGGQESESAFYAAVCKIHCYIKSFAVSKDKRKQLSQGERSIAQLPLVCMFALQGRTPN